MKILVLSFVLLFASSIHSGAGTTNVSDDFHGIDFKNFSYPYRLSSGKHLNFRLKNGQYDYDFPNARGLVELQHVYIADVTGDRKPEAIVMLSHATCGVSCDGGSALFYIYSSRRGRLTSHWQYETGSLGYGCGLKSFSAQHGTMTLELFGRCSRLNQTDSATGKFLVKDVTRLTFKSNGDGFVLRKRQFFSSPERDVRNYEPQFTVAH